MGRGNTWTSKPELGWALWRVVECGIATESFNGALEAVARELSEALEAGCAIALKSGQSDDSLVPIGVHHPDPEIKAQLDAMVGTTVAPGALRQRAAERWGLTAAVVVPVEGRTGELGAIGFARPGGRDFSPVERAFIGAAATAVALVAEDGLLLDALRAATGEEQPTVHPRIARHGRSAGDGLSQREREILGLLAQGHTNREIGDRLGLSVRTVEWHRARLQWKLGVSTRADLVRAARALGPVATGSG